MHPSVVHGQLMGGTSITAGPVRGVPPGALLGV